MISNLRQDVSRHIDNATEISLGMFTLLDRGNTDAKQRVASLVQTLLAKRGVVRTIGDDDDLGESGLSSLDIVNLMLSVETEFDLRIPERDMMPSNFRTIARIDALIAKVSGEHCSVS